MATSNFSTTFGLASKALTDYTAGVQAFLSGNSAMPAIPTTVADYTSTLSGSLYGYSSFQATIAEAQMNRQVEGLRGSSRAIAISGLSRGDFYSAAVASLDSTNSTSVSLVPVQQALMDARHPSQTGKVT